MPGNASPPPVLVVKEGWIFEKTVDGLFHRARYGPDGNGMPSFLQVGQSYILATCMPGQSGNDQTDGKRNGNVIWYLVAGLSDEGKLVEPYWTTPGHADLPLDRAVVDRFVRTDLKHGIRSAVTGGPPTSDIKREYRIVWPRIPAVCTGLASCTAVSIIALLEEALSASADTELASSQSSAMASSKDGSGPIVGKISFEKDSIYVRAKDGGHFSLGAPSLAERQLFAVEALHQCGFRSHFEPNTAISSDSSAHARRYSWRSVSFLRSKSCPSDDTIDKLLNRVAAERAKNGKGVNGLEFTVTDGQVVMDPPTSEPVRKAPSTAPIPPKGAKIKRPNDGDLERPAKKPNTTRSNATPQAPSHVTPKATAKDTSQVQAQSAVQTPPQATPTATSTAAPKTSPQIARHTTSQARPEGTPDATPQATPKAIPKATPQASAQAPLPPAPQVQPQPTVQATRPVPHPPPTAVSATATGAADTVGPGVHECGGRLPEEVKRFIAPDECTAEESAEQLLGLAIKARRPKGCELVVHLDGDSDSAEEWIVVQCLTPDSRHEYTRKQLLWKRQNKRERRYNYEGATTRRLVNGVDVGGNSLNSIQHILATRAERQRRAQAAQVRAGNAAVVNVRELRNASAASPNSDKSPGTGQRGRRSTGGARVGAPFADPAPTASARLHAQQHVQGSGNGSGTAVASGTGSTDRLIGGLRTPTRPTGAADKSDGAHEQLLDMKQSLDEANRSNRELNERVKQQADTISALKDELESAKDKCQTMEDATRDASRALSQLLAEECGAESRHSEELQEHVATQDQTIDESAADVDKQVDQHISRVKADRARLRQLEKELKEAADTRLELENSIATYRRDKHVQARQLAIAEGKCMIWEEDIELIKRKTRQELEEEKKRCEELQQTLDAERCAVVDLKKELKASNDKYVELQSSRPGELASSKELEELNSKLWSKLEVADNKNIRLSESIEEAKQERQSAVEARDLARTELENAKADLARQVQHSRGQKETITQLARQTATDSQKVQNAELERAAAVASRIEVERLANKASERNAQLSVDLAGERAIMKELRAELEKADEAAVAKEAEWDAEERLRETLAQGREADLKRAEEEIVALRESLQAAEARSEKLQKELTDEMARAEDLALRTVPTSHEQQLTYANTMIAQVNKENVRLRSTVRDLKRKLDEHNDNDPLRQLLVPYLPKSQNHNRTEEGTSDTATPSPVSDQDQDRSRNFIIDTAMAGLRELMATPTHQ